MHVKNVKPATQMHLFLDKYYLYSSMCIISVNIRIQILAELTNEKSIWGQIWAGVEVNEKVSHTAFFILFIPIPVPPGHRHSHGSGAKGKDKWKMSYLLQQKNY